jgi:histidine triad (HIT) family protein
MNDCIFCKIINKEIPSNPEHEDDLCMAFPDIHPRAKTHILIIPKKHIPTVKDMEASDEAVFGRMFKVASDLAKKHNLEDYKLLISVGQKAGQEIFHVHLHLMSAPV